MYFQNNNYTAPYFWRFRNWILSRQLIYSNLSGPVNYSYNNGGTSNADYEFKLR